MALINPHPDTVFDFQEFCKLIFRIALRSIVIMFEFNIYNQIYCKCYSPACKEEI